MTRRIQSKLAVFAVLLCGSLPAIAQLQTANPFYATDDPNAIRVLAPELLRTHDAEAGMRFDLPTGESLDFDDIAITVNAGVRSIKGSATGATLLLTTDGQNAFGYIARGDSYFMIDTVDGTPIIARSESLPDPRLITKGWGDDFQIDPDVYNEILQGQSQQDTASAALVPSVVKIAFFYDQALADAEGNQSPRTRSQAAVDFTNAAIAAHGVELTLELVYVGPLAVPLGNGDPFSVFVSEPTKFDTAADYGADLLHYIYEYGGEPYCGKAWLPGREGVSAASCGNFTIAHEIGHNIGLHHDRANAADYGYPWSGYYYGYICGNAGTIMAYYSPRVPHYSSPLLQNGGEDCGVAIGQPDAAFNGEVLEVRREATADYVPDQVTIGTVTIATNGPVQVDEAGAPSVFVDVIRDGDTSQAASVEIGAIETEALAGYDYEDFVQRLEFAPGEVAKQVTINIIDDGTFEPSNEAFEVVLRYPYLLDVVANPLTVTIVSDDPDRGIAEFSAPYAAIWEGHGTLQVPVRRIGSTAETLSVNFNTATITAIPGIDYVESSGTVDFAIGEANATIDIPIINDDDYEGYIAVHFRVFLSGDNVNISQPPYDVYVWNDDLLYGEGRFESDTYYILESTPSVFIGIERINGSDANWDYCALFDPNGTASPNVDYQYYNSVCQTLTDGVTNASIQIAIFDDAEAEGEEYFEATLTSSKGVTNPATTRVVIIDDDAPNAGGGNVGLLQDSYSVDESGGSIDMVVRRESGDAFAAVASYQAVSGTAASGTDFVNASGTLIWPDGDSTDRIVNLVINDDSVVEADENFTFELSNIGGAAAGTFTSADITIVNDDNHGVLAIEQSTAALAEDGYVDIEVSRSVGGTGFVAVQYATQALTAGFGVDYTPVSGSLSWDDGDLSTKTVRITGIDDSEMEPDETLRFFIHAPAGGAVLGDDESMVTIVDDERAATISDASGFSDMSGDGIPDVASFVSSAGGQPYATMSSGADGSSIATMNFLNPTWQGLAIDTVDDANGDGVADDPAVAMLLVEPATGKMMVQARLASTGANVNKINFLNADWAPVDVVVFNDPNGDGIPNDAAIGVMAVNKTTGKILLQVRALSNGAKIATRSFLNSDYTPIAAAAVSRAGQTPLLGVLGVETATGKILVQTRQLSDGLFIDNRKYLSTDFSALDLAVVEDGNSDGTADDPGWLVLANNTVTGANLVQARYAANGGFIKNLAYLTPDYIVQALATSADISGNGREEASVFAVRTSNGQRIMQVRDFDDGSRTINIYP